MAEEKMNVNPDVGTQEDLDAIMKKYDRESNTRQYDGVPKWIVTGL